MNTSSVGPATYTAGEVNDAPACADDLTISAGVTVSVTGRRGNGLTLQAGDDVIIDGTATAAALTIVAGFGDLDGCGTAVINGTISGKPDQHHGHQRLLHHHAERRRVGAEHLDDGAILDCDPVGSDDLDITAGSLALQAATGIGTAAGTGGGCSRPPSPPSGDRLGRHFHRQHRR